MTEDEIYEQYCKATGMFNAKELSILKDAIMQTYDFKVYVLGQRWKELKREFRKALGI